MDYNNPYDNNYLSHYGVLGMRWGIRRYQPYPKGHQGGREVGKAAKVRQRGTVRIVEPKRSVRKQMEKATGIKGYSGNAEITNAEWQQVQKRRLQTGSKDAGKNYLTKKELDYIDTKRKEQNDRLAKARESAQEKKAYETEKQRVMKEGSATEVMSFVGDLSTKEIQDAVMRIEWTTRLSNLSEKEKKSAMDQIDSVMSKVKKGNEWVTTGLNVYKNANEIEKILNGIAKSIEEVDKKSKGSRTA